MTIYMTLEAECAECRYMKGETDSMVCKSCYDALQSQLEDLTTQLTDAENEIENLKEQADG